jgi:hypothetical protein
LCNWWGETWASWSLNLKHVSPSQSSLSIYIIAKKRKNKNKSPFVCVITNWGQIVKKSFWTCHIYIIGSKQKYKGFFSLFFKFLSLAKWSPTHHPHKFGEKNIGELFTIFFFPTNFFPFFNKKFVFLKK